MHYVNKSSDKDTVTVVCIGETNTQIMHLPRLFPHMHPICKHTFSFVLVLLHLWWRKECQSLHSVPENHNERWQAQREAGGLHGAGSSTSQADTSTADCAQVLERNMTPSAVIRVKVKAVSAPERAAGRRLWVQMEKRQSDLVTASMEVWKKQMKLRYRCTAKGHYIICMFRKLGSFRSHQSVMSCLVWDGFFCSFLFFFTCFLTLPSLLAFPFFWSQTVLFLTVFWHSFPMSQQFFLCSF